MKARITFLLFSGFLFASTMQAQVRQGSWTPAVEHLKRGYSSISFWTHRDDGVEIGGGRISVEHGLPRWRPALADQSVFDRVTKGKIWRLGNNKWATLDTQLSLRFGSERVTPGIYYLGLRRSTEDSWDLVLVEPSSVRDGKIDAWAFVARPKEVPIRQALPLDYRRSESASGELQMKLELTTEEEGRLSIQWGPHRLLTTFRIDLPSPEFYKQKGSR